MLLADQISRSMLIARIGTKEQQFARFVADVACAENGLICNVCCWFQRAFSSRISNKHTHAGKRDASRIELFWPLCVWCCTLQRRGEAVSSESFSNSRLCTFRNSAATLLSFCPHSFATLSSIQHVVDNNDHRDADSALAILFVHDYARFDSGWYDEEQIRLMEERCIVLDNDDKYLRDGSKKECHLMTEINKGLLHRAFSVFLFDPATGKLLLQRRAPEKITFPTCGPTLAASTPRYQRRTRGGGTNWRSSCSTTQTRPRTRYPRLPSPSGRIPIFDENSLPRPQQRRREYLGRTRN